MLHFMLDASDSYQESLKDLMSVNECLVRVSGALGLKPVMPPFLVPYYYSKKIEDVGVSAFMLFEGGHITIHTFPYRSCYFADVLSDAFFSVSVAENELLSPLNAKTVKTYSLDRRKNDVLPVTDRHSSSGFGPHYMITVRDVQMTFEGIYKWLDTIAPKINMEAITRPYVIYSTVNKPKYISGVLAVAQSHVAVHYSIAERLAFIDIFSCSFLENEQIENALRESFNSNLTYQLLVRGNKDECHRINKDVRLDLYAQWQRNKYNN